MKETGVEAAIRWVQSCRKTDLSIVCRALDNEPKTGVIVGVVPITHDPQQIILQFYGWSVNLRADGTWWVDEDTSGG